MAPMKVLVVGQGGREHALAWKLARSESVSAVFCAPGNAGIAADATCLDIPANDIPALVEFATTERIDLTVVGPEAPLVDGLVDAFSEAGLTAFGPSSAAAALEGSKAFAKEIMHRGNVPTADYAVFEHLEDAQHFLQEREDQAWVVKADGLAGGKGVVMCANRDEALTAIHNILVNNEFGTAGSKVVIEETLVGEELSILALVDGNTIIPLEGSQDHKRAGDGDTGPNTGGMGAYSPSPLLTPDLQSEIEAKILVPTIHAMKLADTPFCGLLYAGLMITRQGPKVLEFNVRFGDPEAQPILMRLNSDLGLVLKAAAEGRLDEFGPLEWDDRPAVCVVMASDGYPGSYETGRPIRGIDEANSIEGVQVFHAGTTEQDNQLLSDGGRVLGVTALGDQLADAKRQAYEAVRCIRWEGAWCRKDISDKARQP
ncbi:MAG TPA: phosphoribosylamine--glycine ligase [Planctomycetaceae bacterium]|nr:phosphoribosylamine--glycine ligase [Planctomycetaceae bacterium]